MQISPLNKILDEQKLQIRESQDQETKSIIHLRGIQQGHIGIHDCNAFTKSNNFEFWSGFLQNKPVSIIGLAKYGQDLIYVGSYYVIRQLRGQGIGLKTWDYVINNLKVCNLALNSIMSQQKNYQKYGFKTQSKGIRYLIKGTNCKYESQFLVNCNEVDFQLLSNYDMQNFPIRRQQFLKTWINLPLSKAIAFLRDSKVEGYGVLRKTLSGYKIGPLFANDYEVASTILNKLISQVPQQNEVILDTPEPHENIMRLAEEFRMVHEVFYARMFTNGQPQIFRKKTIYGITTSEFS